MEKAILKTLIYADIFDYPLFAYEVHKWLIGKEASIEQIEKILKRMVKNKKITAKEEMFFLRGRVNRVEKRLANEKNSHKFYGKAQLISQFFRIIPWIQLVGISGSLAMRNADQKADIDLFVVTRKNRVWLSRLFSAFILEFLGQRRRRGESRAEGAGKICLNLLISEDVLEQPKQNLYIAHEVLQMKVLWERGKTYQKFLEQNAWVKKYLPNWIGMSAVERQLGRYSRRSWAIGDFFERVVGLLQMRYMGKIEGAEVVKQQALYFHPEDNGTRVMQIYESKVKKLLKK